MPNLIEDDRAMSPVVEKSLAIGIALAYIAGTTGLVYGGLGPDYERATADELGERVLATAAGAIEGAPPAVDGRIDRRRSIELPRTIDGERYEIAVVDDRLELDHPDDRLEAATTLSLPPGVTATGAYESDGPLEITVTGPPDNRTLAVDTGE